MNETYRKMLEDSIIPFNETLDFIVESIEKNIKNKDLSLEYLRPEVEELKVKVKNDKVDSLRAKYRNFKNMPSIRMFDIMESFIYNSAIITPDHTANKLFDSLDNLNLLLRNRIIYTGIAKVYSLPVFSSKAESDYWDMEFAKNLNNMVDSAEEAGVCISYISSKKHKSKFSNFITNRVNSKLTSYGITHPKSAPQDFKVAAKYVKDIVHKLVYTQPKLYPD